MYPAESGGGHRLPVLDALLRRKDTQTAGVRPFKDTESELALEAYIEISKERDARLDSLLAKLAKSQKEIIVWGAGTHTQRLLAEGRMEDLHISAFVDANPHLQGSRVAGRPILAPLELKGHTEAILISSYAFQEEIRAQIRESLGLDNEIITCY